MRTCGLGYYDYKNDQILDVEHEKSIKKPNMQGLSFLIGIKLMIYIK